jgi:hypothetical protein
MALVLRPPGSRESLPETLADLGRFRKAVAVAGGAFALAAAALLSVALACGLDAALDLPPAARAAALAAALTLCGVVWLRGVGRARRLRTDALSVALELEDRYPDLNDSLASAVAFLEADGAEDRGLSANLQQATVARARRQADRHDLDSLAPTGRAWRAFWACAFAVAVAGGLTLADPDRAAAALARLADPYGTHPWPTKTRVEILAPDAFPTRVAKGEPFDLRFAVRGLIPEQAAVAVRFAGGEEWEEPYPLSAGNDFRAVVSARIDPSRLPASFAFRVTANDADTGWQRVEVVPPPRLVPVDGRASPLFRVTPPAYTGLPQVDLPDGATALEIPAGSAVTFRAATDVRVAAAALAFAGDREPFTRPAGLAPAGHLHPLAALAAQHLADAVGRDIPVSLDPAGRGLAAAFVPSASGPYVLRLTDETGITGTRVIDIRLVPDPAPTVTLLRPTAADPTVLTPAATLAVHLSAVDKVYAVRRTFLEYRVNDGPVRTVPLTDLPDAGGPLAAVVGGPGLVAPARPTSVEAHGSVGLASFTRDGTHPVRDGDVLLVRGAADDWDDVSPAKAPGRSEWFEVRVASPDAVEAWLQRELAALRPDLLRLLGQQRDARQKAGEVVPRPDGTLDPADRDRLLAAEQLQRQVRGKVSDPRDGLRAKADLLRQTVRANDLPPSRAAERAEAVADLLGRVADRYLPVIEPSLADARRLGAGPPAPGQERAAGDALRQADRYQKAAEDGFTDLLGLLAVWGGAGEIRGEARALRDFVRRQAADVEKTEGKPSQAESERAGARADQAAEQGDRLIARAGRLAGEKEAQAAAARAAAGVKTDEAAALREKAAGLPAGAPEKSALNAKAAALDAEAAELKAAGDKAGAEAAALRAAVKAAGGQGLPEDLRAAGEAVRNDRRSDAGERLQAAARRLDQLIEQLTEKPPEAAPDLAKKLKAAADDIDGLAAAQDDLRKRTAEAAAIKDPAERAAALKGLVAEQEKLIARGRELFQRLSRERAATARDVRTAVDQMESAKTDLENGAPGLRAQNDAVETLDGARDRLDAGAAAAPQQLSDEKRRKLADRVKGLLERQQAAASEADRVHALVARDKKWDRDALTAYADLEDRERAIAGEVRGLGEKEFAPLPVLARLLTEAAGAAESAADKAKARREDADPALAFDAELEAVNDKRVKRPIDLATRRLSQLLDALKPDDPKAKKDPPAKAPDPAAPPPAGGDGDVVPPLAQLKVLRALQAELNGRTAEFATLHPDPDKLTEEERAELKELEDAQRDIAALFEKMAGLLRQQGGIPPDAPDPAPEKP